ncbi:GNAT family N-acetyltransferase [Telluribacter humicola]|uniref:GNAT family N-acetyltransferase n=1 Tax=Telluribacter humicola TaxID=1720261 RepID=UPI001A97ADE1|nr:GNAT family N-acetyltransferase [Telluribacter humicola]
MAITYHTDRKPTPEEVIFLYEEASLPRPTHDEERIRQMYQNSDLVITAWDGELLVGVARSITDWVWSCYLADLAVRTAYQKMGIGKRLIQMTKEQVGEQSMVLLLSVPAAMEYYPKVGFARQESSFIINRDR